MPEFDLSRQDFTNTDPAFNLCSVRACQDIVVERQRRLVYSKSTEDDDMYAALDAAGIPQLPRIEENSDESFTKVSVPNNTRSLLRIVMPERPDSFNSEITIGIEDVFHRMLRLLHATYEATGGLPEGLGIDNLAFVKEGSGEICFVPPLLLVHGLAPETVIPQLTEQVMQSAPPNVYRTFLEVLGL